MKTEKHICVGLLAHVDAGKTTLAESMLYLSGQIRRLGRVDHRDTFLDTDALERERGITIFSKQAELKIRDWNITLLDTPGHVDFSAEMERTLQVLDYAILIVSGADGVQGHVETLWKLLARYRIPVFLFINKMDQEGTDPEALLAELQSRLSGNCLDFSGSMDEGSPAQKRQLWENLALCDEAVMEYYLEHETVTERQTIRLIRERKVFPCYFGSALKLIGVSEFLEGFMRYTESPEYPAAFGARVFKITRDTQGNRLTHMKITGGTLRVKELVRGNGVAPTERAGTEALSDVHGAGQLGWEEKVDQIRIYSGTGYEMVKEAVAGTICAVTGLTKTYAGEGLGMEENIDQPILEPVLNYKLELPEGCDAHVLLKNLRQLEEEEPLLHIRWDEESGEIHAQLMGEVQIEVLRAMIRERYGVEVVFGNGSIVYKETITAPSEGVGHFEPLRHYAEVHLLLEPGEPGSGLTFSSACSEDVLDGNWQRLVLTHLEEKQHRGVLTGSEITDMKITLLCGKAHPKHTEGGDFRQATYRAVRQGLRMAECRLLEPVYEYRLEIPADQAGRAMADIQRMHGSFRGPEFVDAASGRTAHSKNDVIDAANPMGASSGMVILAGTAPAATMQGYQREVTSYTRGRGRLSCSLKGYEPCHNEEEVIAAIGYEPERDLENPTGSVFCAHGAGFVGTLAAQLQGNGRQMLGCVAHDLFSHGLAAGEEDIVEAFLKKAGVLGTSAGDDGHVRFIEAFCYDLLYDPACGGRVGTCLKHSGISGGQGIHQGIDTQQERIIPRAHDQRYAAGRGFLEAPGVELRQRCTDVFLPGKSTHMLLHVGDLAEGKPHLAHIALEAALAKVFSERFIDLALAACDTGFQLLQGLEASAYVKCCAAGKVLPLLCDDLLNLGFGHGVLLSFGLSAFLSLV